jgi:predicted acetyltransferase
MTLKIPAILVRPALSTELACIENMMQFYNYDLSESLPVDFAETGLYAIQPKAQYWLKPGVAPFVIYVDGELAGFAVVDDEVIQPQSQYNMGYFFIARRYRGRGVGKQVANKLFSQFSGAWEIYFYTTNETASKFWNAVIAKSSAHDVAMSAQIIDSEPCTLVSFSTGANKVVIA